MADLRSYAVRQSFELKAAAVSIVAVLLSFGSGLWLENAAHLNMDTPVLAVVLALTLARTQRGAELTARLPGLVVLPVIGIVAARVGRMMIEHPNVGDTLFALAVVLSIWLRRFGPRVAKAGTLIALPFLAVLITPMPLPPGNGAMSWSAVVAVIAWFWVTVVQLAAQHSGFLPAPAGVHGRGAAPAKPRRPSSLRPPASTRMAIQMGLSLGAAFVLGRLAFTPHWTWMVLTAFIVCSGNQGRGDVLYKGLLRIAGAAVGTVAATLLAGVFGPRDVRSVVLIFVVLGVATWLRSLSYAYWAGCVTAVLALLQGYFGETSTSLLLTRLEEILLGAVLAVVISWTVLPVPSGKVVRRRMADALATLDELRAAVRRDPKPDPVRLDALGARFAADLELLERVAQPIRAHRLMGRVLRRLKGGSGSDSGARHLADKIDAVLRQRDTARALLQGAALQETALQEAATVSQPSPEPLPRTRAAAVSSADGYQAPDR